MKLKIFIVLLLLACSGGLVWFAGGSHPNLISDPASSLVPSPAAQEQHSALPRAPASQPTRVDQALERLNQFSSGRWSLGLGAHGYATRMKDAALPIEADSARSAADSFLQDFGPELLGLSAGSAIFFDQRLEDGASQLVYHQTLHSFPVFGSRISLFLDRDGRLVYLLSDIYAGPPPAPSPSVITPHAASLQARAALLRELPAAANVPIEKFFATATLGYRLLQENISIVYRFELALADLQHPDYEILIDANDSSVILVKKLSRN